MLQVAVSHRMASPSELIVCKQIEDFLDAWGLMTWIGPMDRVCNNYDPGGGRGLRYEGLARLSFMCIWAKLCASRQFLG